MRNAEEVGMDLENEVKRLFAETATTHLNILPSIAKAEEFLKESYEGRYFFELIQNARDANKALNKDGVILIQLEEDRVNVSNTGAAFSSAGVESICRIGMSDKASQDFIGHKGYGFKSVQEITERPLITTEFGTLYFDKQKTLNESYPDNLIEPDAIPLFFFPHFSEDKLERNRVENETDIVTQIVLPFRTGVSKNKVYSDFSQIGGKQLALLGNISKIVFSSDMGDVIYQIDKRPTTHLVEVSRNGESTFFKEFQPRRKIIIPDDVYLKLEKREKQLFEKDRGIEIKILLEWDRQQKKLVQSDGTKLYLFYPLEITSGFRFLIHSYFSVNPERKELRKTALNEFILKQIADYITGTFIEDIKRSNRASVLQILCFRRIDDSRLDDLYNRIIDGLRDRKFLYDEVTKRFYSPTEVMIADKLDKELFPEGVFAGKRLIFVDDEEIRGWLTNELDIPYLTYEFIRDNIESECKRQKSKRNIEFFQVLYNYAISHQNLHFDGKNVLLTEHWGLVSNDIDVFYGGTRRKISIPKSLRGKITFIHKGISISDFREGRSNTGIIEFSTYALVTRLLKLFEDPDVNNIEVIRLLKNLVLDRRSLTDIKSRILVPIKDTNKWVNPLHDPVYFDREEIKELYPEANYIDIDRLMEPTENRQEWENFLRSVNVWDVPALFIETYELASADQRNNDFMRYTGKSSKPFSLRNDRRIDIPVKFNDFFFESIISNWDDYISFIEDSELPNFACRSQYSNNYDPIDNYSVLKLSHFLNYLRTNSWIWISGKDTLYATNEVVAIDLDDFRRSHLQVLKKYINIIPINFAAKHRLLEILQTPHLNKPTVENYINILNLLQNMHPEPKQTKDFEDCFNRILGYLSEFYNNSSNSIDNITSELSTIQFLAYNEINSVHLWEYANNILYIDDKALYDRLPTIIKSRLQPLFTNRDKNTFGKIAVRIGKVLSRLIEKNIVKSGQIRSISLMQDTPTLAILLTLIEGFIQRSLSDTEIGAFREAQIFEWEDLKIRITLADIEGFDELIEANYAIDRIEDTYLLHIRPDAVWGNSRVKAQALSSLFESIIQGDLRGFTWLIEAFFGRPSGDVSRQFINDHDISPQRISELRDLLEERTYSLVQQFWMAILNLKNKAAGDNLLSGNTVDLNWLSEQIDFDVGVLNKIHSEINYENLSDQANIETLNNLFNKLEIKLRDFNLLSYTPISFNIYHKDELRKVKNNFENKFKTWLYHFLIKKEVQEQAIFQELLDKYGFFDPDADADAIKMDYINTFDKLIQEEFSMLPFSLEALRKENRHVDISKVFYSNRRKLLTALRKAKLSSEFVDEYLQENNIRSRLYFGFHTDFVDDYIHKFGKRIEDKARDNAKHDYQKSLKDYYDMKNQEISDYETKSVDFPTRGKGKGGKRQFRWDGGQGDNNRAELIGIVGESNVYRKILKKYPSAKWVSRNAYKAGVNPEGEDGLGYDIEYTNENGVKYYIEVKSKINEEKSFTITQNEINKALETQQRYMIVFVTNTLDNQNRKYINLGNIFLFDEGEDFINNSKFRAVNDEFKILFE